MNAEVLDKENSKTCSACRKTYFGQDIENNFYQSKERSTDSKKRTLYRGKCKSCTVTENSWRAAIRKINAAGAVPDTGENDMWDPFEPELFMLEDFMHRMSIEDTERNMEKIADHVKELLGRTEFEVFHGNLPKKPCEICGSVMFLRPKYLSFDNHTVVKWRCPNHYSVPYHGYPEDHI